MLRRLLDRLPALCRLEAVGAEWDSHLSPECFTRLPAAYFAKTGSLSDTVPCRNPRHSCHRPHLIEQTAPGVWFAYSQPDQVCPRFQIQHADRVLWRLNLTAIFRDAAEALTLELQPQRIREFPDLWNLGTWSKKRVPVYLSLGNGAMEDGHNADVVCSFREPAFVFLVPSTDHYSPDTRSAVTRAGGRFGSLIDMLRLDGRKGLIATREISDEWRDLSKEPAAALPRFHVPPGTPWASITVRVKDAETIVVSTDTGGTAKEFSRDGLHQMTGRGPKRSWAFLRQLADRRAFHMPLPQSPKACDDLNNRVREVNALLRRIIVGTVDTQPIRLSRRLAERGYHWDFKLTSDI